MMPWVAFNGRHPNTAHCAKGVEWKWLRLTAEEMRASTERAFQTYGCSLTSVSFLKYLGRVPTASDDDWSSVVGNLRKARMEWAQLLRTLGQGG